MATFNYKKYQILLNADSKKTQGLQVGDIVRRQYFDGKNVIYSLMCVLENGIEKKQNSDTGETEERPYFIGALLEGDEPQQNEILDFARITNLFNVDRSGALYLTASDDEAPFMDVIDGIGRNASLSWPENIASKDFEDSESQYVVKGLSSLDVSYEQFNQGNNRILTVTRTAEQSDAFEGLKQDFYQFIESPNRVLISYKIKASENIKVTMSLGYIDDLKRDAIWDENITTEWEYKLHVITVGYSGRHLRSFKISMSDLPVKQNIQIADFNIILLSSVSNFADASSARIGKLDGVKDPVFGNLEGYGAYLQKLYAAHSAHISGTLTAGDENGFGATFYAGKIHKNCFVRSTDISFATDIIIDDKSVVNPTGIGHVYKFDSPVVMEAQSNEWLLNNLGKRYCFSFWVYAKQQCQLGISQNGKNVRNIQVNAVSTHKWIRVHAFFDLSIRDNDNEALLIGITPLFVKFDYDQTSSKEPNPDEDIIFITAPQLESGETVTQYQPTDEKLNYTEDYGAWFARGGIGGTIQNPLLQLNYDGNGSIGTRTKSIELKQDGSGYLANKNISWDEEGKVTFGKNVTLNWDNLDDKSKDEMTNRYIRIIGEDTFAIIGQQSSDDPLYSPVSITLSLDEVGLTSTSSQRQWYYKYHGEFIAIPNANSQYFTLTPDSDYWDSESVVTFKCVVTLNESHVYSDVFTVKKQYVQGYTLEVTSSKGKSFQNGKCDTELLAQVYYQGKLVDEEYALSNFIFTWHCYDANTGEEILDFEGVIDNNKLTLDHELTFRERYICELSVSDSFDYSFPIIF